MDAIWSALPAGLMSGAIYAFLGVSYLPTLRSSGIVSLANGEIFMFAALLAHRLVVVWEWPLAPAVVTIVGAAALAGWASDVVVLRRVRSNDLFRGLIVTFGLALLVQEAARATFGTDPLVTPRFPWVPRSIQVGDAGVAGQILWIIGILVLLVVGISWIERRSSFGQRLRAVAADAEMAETIGIRTGWLRGITFAASGALAGLAGVLAAPVIFMTYLGGTLIGLKGLVALFVGGSQGVSGPVIGGLLLGVVEATTAATVGGEWQDAAAFLVLLAVLLVFPSGLGRTAIRDLVRRRPAIGAAA